MVDTGIADVLWNTVMGFSLTVAVGEGNLPVSQSNILFPVYLFYALHLLTLQ